MRSVIGVWKVSSHWIPTFFVVADSRKNAVDAAEMYMREFLPENKRNKALPTFDIVCQTEVKKIRLDDDRDVCITPI